MSNDHVFEIDDACLSISPALRRVPWALVMWVNIEQKSTVHISITFLLDVAL